MKRYQLAKLIEWAGTLEARKRLQKVVYLLQISGAPFDLKYELYHYGPYSRSLANLTNNLAEMKVVRETYKRYVTGGSCFSYCLTEDGKKAIEDYEDNHGADAEEVAKFKDAFADLNELDVSVLEYAATIVYFHELRHNLDGAITEASRFKGVEKSDTSFSKAIEVAERILQPQ